MGIKGVVDANVLLRYLLEDNVQQAAIVRRWLKEEGSLFLADTILAEMVWVLESHYTVPRQEIVRHLLRMIALPDISCDQPLLEASLRRYAETGLDYVDCYLMALALANGQGVPVYSFDQDFKRLPPGAWVQH
jgi:predicted nucleic-acid-binding protein